MAVLTPKRHQTHRRFIERSSNRSMTVDRENGVLRGVKLLGALSKNNRRYSESAMRSARQLYEGKKIYVDHPTAEGDRSFDRWAGVIEHAEFREGRGIFGDVRLRKASRYYEEILEAATDFPESLGFSHVADGNTRMEGDTEIVEDINEVFSVDLVMEPATTAGIFEGVKNKSADRLSKESQQSLDRIRALVVKASTNAAEAMERARDKGDRSPLSDHTSLIRDIGDSMLEWLEDDDRQGSIGTGDEYSIKGITDDIADLLENPLKDGAMQNLMDKLADLKSIADALDRPNKPAPQSKPAIESRREEAWTQKLTHWRETLDARNRARKLPPAIERPKFQPQTELEKRMVRRFAEL